MMKPVMEDKYVKIEFVNKVVEMIMLVIVITLV